jgi:hypothetical protein
MDIDFVGYVALDELVQSRSSELVARQRGKSLIAERQRSVDVEIGISSIPKNWRFSSLNTF